jgi:hypothetical protein
MKDKKKPAIVRLPRPLTRGIPSFDEIKEALRDLAQRAGPDVALRCVSEALGRMVEPDEARGLEARRGGIWKLWGGRGSLLAPGEDHSQLFSKGGQFNLFVAEPYDVDLKTMDDIVRFCKQYGLTASINGRSSYSVGRTVRLEYRMAHSTGPREQGHE